MSTSAQNAAKFGIAAAKKWWSAARELAVSFDRTGLENAIVSWIKLNRRDEVSNTTPSVDFYYALMNEAFLSLYDAETINPVYPITDLGQKFIDESRGSTGIGAMNLPAPPEPVLSPAKQLEATVRRDFELLPSKRFREKVNNDRAYRECFERLAPTLQTAVTTRVLISET